MKYRPEIDGMRTLAVLPVLFFHANIPYFSGGFVGVDIFFVISGFLISSILLYEISHNKFSFISFYERRLRRLMPAFITVLLTTSVLAFLILPPEALTMFGKSLISSVFISANLFFMLNLDYFSLSAESMLLLHIWSLSVEEQFYVIFPIILLMAFWLSKKIGPALAIWTAFLLSFIYMIYLGEMDNQSTAFYSVFARAWEMLAGSLLAIHYPKIQTQIHNKTVRHFMSIIGFTLIVYAILFSTKADWPNSEALIPVLGTLLLLAFVDHHARLGKCLSWGPVVYLGLISYPLYLWHQPLFAIARNYLPNEPSQFVFLCLIAMSVVLSALTFRFIENPFKNKERYKKKHVYTLTGLLLVIVAATGAVAYKMEGLPGRYAIPIPEFPKKIDRSCVSRESNKIEPGNKLCHRNIDYPVEIAVLGDSHTNSLAITLSKALPEVGLQQFSKSGCGPALTFNSKVGGCNSWNKKSLELILNDPKISHVVVNYRHAQYIADVGIDTYSASFKLLTGSLIDADKRVILIMPFPELTQSTGNSMYPKHVFSKERKISFDKANTSAAYQQKQGQIIDIISRIALHPNVDVISSTDEICSDETGYCQSVIGEEPLYYDDNHLTLRGVQSITNKLADTIKKH